MDFVQMLERFGPWIVAGLGKLFELAMAAGSRDAFLTALDGALVAARAKTDIDLAKKHGIEP